MPDTWPKPLSAAAEAGWLMLGAGAEAARVEDTMVRLAVAYGMHVEAVALPTLILLHGDEGTLVRRVLNRRTNLAVVELVNQWSREAAAGRLDVDTLLERMRGARHVRRHPIGVEVAAAGVAAAGLALLFGARWPTLPWAAAAGLLAQATRMAGRLLPWPGALVDMLAAFCAVWPALVAAAVHVGQPGLVVVGGIMVLVPGVLLTTAVRDGMNGDLLSSAARLLEAGLVAGSVAGGATLAIYLYVQAGGRWP